MSMRLLAVPLARQRAAGAAPVLTLVAQHGARPSVLGAPTTRQPLTTQMMNRASDFWLSLGRTDVSSIWDWKRRLFLAGERIMDRIEYEEWALKGIDPETGPSVRQLAQKPEANDAKGTSAPAAQQKVPVLYPPSFISRDVVLEEISALAHRRSPHHRRQLVYNAIGILITAPFLVVPVIPNIPMYYFMWRAWSHYRAWMSSRYLLALLEHNLLEPGAEEEMDAALHTHEEQRDPVLAKALVDQYSFLLDREHISQLGKRYDLSEQNLIDLRRAQQQLTLRIAQKQNEQIKM